jgi:hypothetical protein
MELNNRMPARGWRAHSTPDPETEPPPQAPPTPRPEPDDVPLPSRAPVQEPNMPTPPVKA